MFKRPFLYSVIVLSLFFAGCLICGKVVDENGVGVAGVTVTLTGGDQSRTTTTDGDGKYRFGDLFKDDMIPAGSYTVTPSESECIVIPASTNVTITSQTFSELGDVPSPVQGVDFETICNWEDYDNFDSGSFDPNLWIIDNQAGTISIENGKAKFEHIAGAPGGICNLWMINSPETIKAAIGEITIVSYTGDVFPRLVGFQGKKESHPIINQCGIIPQQGLIGGLLVEIDSSYNFLGVLSSGTIVSNLDLDGSTNTIGSTFFGFRANSQEGFWYAKEFGISTFEYQDITPPTPDIVQKAFGTYSQDGSGTCVVYLDNVKVLR